MILQLLLPLDYLRCDSIYVAWHTHDLFTDFDEDEIS